MHHYMIKWIRLYFVNVICRISIQLLQVFLLLFNVFVISYVHKYYKDIWYNTEQKTVNQITNIFRSCSVKSLYNCSQLLWKLVTKRMQTPFLFVNRSNFFIGCISFRWAKMMLKSIVSQGNGDADNNLHVQITHFTNFVFWTIFY